MPRHETKTAFRLGGVDLWLTSLNWPVYRGAQHIPVTFYQPGEAFEALSSLTFTEGGLDLEVICNGPGGRPRLLTIRGVFLIDLQKIHDGENGTRVTIADRRYLLNYRVIDESWGILFQGKYLAGERGFGTAESPTLRWRLAEALDRFILIDFPFANHTRSDVLDVFFKTDLEMRIPNDILSAGKAFVPNIDALLDFWGFDLSVDIDGDFYFADRIEDARGQRDTSSDTGGGYNWIRDHTDEMEWILRDPDFETELTRLQSLVPANFKVRFWEDHTLQVPFPDRTRIDRRTISGGPVGARRALTQHGLVLVQVYEALGGFFTYKNLMLAYGEDERLVGQGPRQFFNKPTMRDTGLDTSAPAIDDITREKRFTLQEVVRSSERGFYVITHESGSEGTSAWTTMRLGKLNGSGNIQPQKVIGNWTEVFLKVPEILERQRIKKTGFPDQANKLFDLGWITDVGKRDKLIQQGIRLARRSIPICIVHSTRSFQGVEPGEIPDGLELPSAQLPPVPVLARGMDEASAIGVKWKSAPSGVVELMSDQRRMRGRSQAIIGVPVRIPLVNSAERPEDIRKAAIFDAFLLRANLRLAQKMEDMEWDLNYEFWVKVVARRQGPNNEFKFWTEEVKGPEGAIGPTMELEADPTVPARRDEVNYIRGEFAVAESLEKSRPNGNDGFGKILNLTEIKEEAERRVRNKIAEMTAEAQFSHEFMNIEILKERTLQGALDSFMLRLENSVVYAEVNTGVRGQETTRRSEAMRRSLQTEALIQGKFVGK